MGTGLLGIFGMNQDKKKVGFQQSPIIGDNILPTTQFDGAVLKLLQTRVDESETTASPLQHSEKNKYIEFPGAEIQEEYYGGLNVKKK